MTWNYRVVRGQDGLQLFDVYYDEAGSPIATSASPSYVYGETVEELATQLTRMREALNRPILDEADIGSELGGDHTAG
jgi:hypothetical protein